jgi:hypothetical protein
VAWSRISVLAAFWEPVLWQKEEKEFRISTLQSYRYSAVGKEETNFNYITWTVYVLKYVYISTASTFISRHKVLLIDSYVLYV